MIVSVSVHIKNTGGKCMLLCVLIEKCGNQAVWITLDFPRLGWWRSLQSVL